MGIVIPLGRVMVRLSHHTYKVLRMVLACNNCSRNITYHFAEDSKYPLGVKKMSLVLFKCRIASVLSFFFLFCFFGPHPRHMEVPRLRVKSELELLAYTTAHSNASQILNPLSEARD